MKILSKICSNCKTRFFKQYNRALSSWEKAKFCSYQCYWEDNVGKKRPDWVKEKLSKARSGKGNSNWKGGQTKEERNFQKNQWHRRRRLAEGTHTFKEWQELKSKHNNTCLCCGEKEPDIALTIDHIIPLSKGGTDYIDNIQPLCKSCNCKKHTGTTDYTQSGSK